MESPETRYARSGDVSIAYKVFGKGPVDVVFAPGTVSNIDADYNPNDPFDVWYFERFRAFCRLILFDKRGTGLSDRVTDAATLEERTDDIRAVMDAAGSRRAVILGLSEGGAMACLFAATHPDRTSALIVWGGQARWVREPDMPWGIPEDDYEALIEHLATQGVTEQYVRGWGAGIGPRASPETVASVIRYFQVGASPASLAALERMNMQIDIRDILPAISVPTLIINASGDPVAPIEGARYLAERIPDARLFEYAGETHLPSERQTWAQVLDEIEEFVTGTRPRPPIDRVLATVMFTDIVGSTARAAELGDAAWKDLLAAHDERARVAVEHHRGRYVDSTGDGLLATFDGPARAVRCAMAIGDAMDELGLQIRAGCHTGEVELSGDQVRGIAVHIGARVAAAARPSEVWVSSTVKDLVVGSGLVFADQGEHTLKGVPDRWHLYQVVS